MESSIKKVTLQINLSPSDYPLAKHILTHQLNALSTQVNEILLVVESKPSKGRFSHKWDENKTNMNYLLKEISTKYSAKIIHVDYSPETKKKIASYFFKLEDIPEKDYRGGPFYSYFFGLYYSSYDLILHLDSDILLGGYSQTWVTEAIEIIDSSRDIFTVTPLPGPPADDKSLKNQNLIKCYTDEPYKYEIVGFSSRIFMLRKSVLNKYSLKLQKISPANQFTAILKGNTIADLPEHLISSFMSKHKLKRIDFLGRNQGLWSLHPPYKSDSFNQSLPIILSKITEHTFPKSQRGFYDIVDDFFDWSEARHSLRQKSWHQKCLSRFKLKGIFRWENKFKINSFHWK